MTTVRVTPCSCGGIPEARVERGGEDFMEAYARCPKCGLSTDGVEHVWGGEEARLMAYAEWNRMRREEPDKKPVAPCAACGGVGYDIVDGEFADACKICQGAGEVEKPVPDKGQK